MDLDAVQSFVTVAELASFTRAAGALDTTQANISLRVKRLEARVGRRLLDRTPRAVRLTADGVLFLAAARDLLAAQGRALSILSRERRRVAVGFSDHVIGGDLPGLLRRIAWEDSEVCLDLRIGHSRDLLAAYEAREFDLVVLRGLDGGGGERLRRDEMGWFAGEGYRLSSDGILALATLSPRCGIRDIALAALDDAGKAWREAFCGGGLGAVSAAVSADLAVAPLSCRAAPVSALDVTGSLGLPGLPAFDVMLHVRSSRLRASKAVERLAAALALG